METLYGFKMKGLIERYNVITIIWLLLCKLTPAIKIYFSRNALIHVFFPLHCESLSLGGLEQHRAAQRTNLCKLVHILVDVTVIV